VVVNQGINIMSRVSVLIFTCIFIIIGDNVYAEWQYLFTLDEYSPAYRTRFIENGCDLNHDTYDDLLFGNAYFNDNEGMVKIIYGAPDADTAGDWIVHGPDTYPLYFGRQILNVGDLDGDGESDIIVTEPYYDEENGCPRYGNLYLYFSSPFDTLADLILSGFEPGSNVAYGDFNGDEYSDIIISRPGGPYSIGVAKLYLGGPFMDNTPDWVYNTQIEQVLELFGAERDFNGDGYDDFTFWVSDEHLIDPEHTTISIYAGDPNLEFEPCIIFQGPVTQEPSQSNEYRFEWVGDFNSDGFDDFTISRETHYDENISFSKIYLGNSSSDTLNSFYLYYYEDALDSLTIISENLSCLNSDTYSDIVIYYRRWGVSSIDSAVILYGNSDSLSIERESLIHPNLKWIKNCGNINGSDYAELAFTLTGDIGTLAVYSKNNTSIETFNQYGNRIGDMITYPNPFNSSTTISFNTSNYDGPSEVFIYDLKGGLVNKLKINKEKGTVWNAIDFHGNAVASGLYFMQARSKISTYSAKLVYLK